MVTRFERFAMEPPFRRIYQKLLRLFSPSPEAIDRWELGPRPHYFAGVYAAAMQARREDIDAITVAEFGVLRQGVARARSVRGDRQHGHWRANRCGRIRYGERAAGAVRRPS